MQLEDATESAGTSSTGRTLSSRARNTWRSACEALVAAQRIRLGQTLRDAIREKLRRLELIEPVICPSVDEASTQMPHPDSHSLWLALSQASPPQAFPRSPVPPVSDSRFRRGDGHQAIEERQPLSASPTSHSLSRMIAPIPTAPYRSEKARTVWDLTAGLSTPILTLKRQRRAPSFFRNKGQTFTTICHSSQASLVEPAPA